MLCADESVTTIDDLFELQTQIRKFVSGIHAAFEMNVATPPHSAIVITYKGEQMPAFIKGIATDPKSDWLNNATLTVLAHSPGNPRNDPAFSDPDTWLYVDFTLTTASTPTRNRITGVTLVGPPYS